MNPEICLRPARADDASCLAALAIQVWLHTYATDGVRPALANYVLTQFTPQRFEHCINSTRHRVIVAEQGEHLLGYALLDFDSYQPAVPHTSTELQSLYVLPRFARQGIGSALLHACANAAQDQAADATYWLSVNSQNHNALAFYASHQFEQYGTLFFELDSVRYANQILATV